MKLVRIDEDFNLVFLDGNKIALDGVVAPKGLTLERLNALRYVERTIDSSKGFRVEKTQKSTCGIDNARVYYVVEEREECLNDNLIGFGYLKRRE